jgi:transposase
MTKHHVQLNEQQRQKLLDITGKGKVAVRIYKRSQIVLLSDEGYKDTEIAERVGVGVATVERVRQKFVQRGLDEALAEAPRPGGQRRLDGIAEAFLVATACSDAPQGGSDWTMQLLAEGLVKVGVVDAISDETVRRTLKKTSSSRG